MSDAIGIEGVNFGNFGGRLQVLFVDVGQLCRLGRQAASLANPPARAGWAPDIRFLARFGKSSCYGAPRRRVCSSALQQLIRIDVDGHGDVFGEWQFVEGFAHEPAQAHDGFAADQNVKSELAL